MDELRAGIIRKRLSEEKEVDFEFVAELDGDCIACESININPVWAARKGDEEIEAYIKDQFDSFKGRISFRNILLDN